jgi:hypothetical protein
MGPAYLIAKVVFWEVQQNLEYLGVQVYFIINS